MQTTRTLEIDPVIIISSFNTFLLDFIRTRQKKKKKQISIIFLHQYILSIDWTTARTVFFKNSLHNHLKVETFDQLVKNFNTKFHKKIRKNISIYCISTNTSHTYRQPSI